MSYPDGDTITDYYSTIVPMTNDLITDDEDDIYIEYKVIERNFSIRNEKVILLVQKIEDYSKTK